MPPFEPDLPDLKRRRDIFFSLFFIFLSGILIFLPVDGQQRISAALRASVLSPFLLTQQSLHQARVRAVEVSEIQARLDSAVAVLSEQTTLLEENRRLRALLELRSRAGPTFVPASAIRAGTRGSESMFLLDVGSEDGVAVNDPVVVAEGLVGVVREVGPRTALAMDWTHPDFRVSVMTLDGEAFGIVEPRPGVFREEDRLVLDGIPYHSSLDEGTLLVTSGQGSVYPRGVTVGSILELAGTEAGWRRSYWVVPAVRPGSVTHVLVLTGDEGSPIEDLFHLWNGEPEEVDPESPEIGDSVEPEGATP